MPGEGIEVKVVRIHNPENVNVIPGQFHFIRTVEGIAEAVVGSVPGAKFGIAFSEASGECLVRIDGNDEDLIALARDNAEVIAAGHSCILFLRDCYPHNILNAIKNLQEGGVHDLLCNGKCSGGCHRRISSWNGNYGRH